MELDGADDLTPEQREEVQEYYLLRYMKARNFRVSGQPERRQPKKVRERWQTSTWRENAVPAMMRDPIYPYQRARYGSRAGSGNYGNTNAKGRGR